VLAADAADVLVLKPMALGGPDRTLDAARAARDAGADAVVTTTIDGVVARLGALHVAAAVPEVPACGLATGSLLAEDLAPDPAPVRDGSMAVPGGPGLAGDALDSLY
jgi:L-alanine-DL-glutamate epimerase-like enolase superfamily enzyme